MARFILPDTDSITLNVDTIDKIIARGDGEIALVYLCILRFNGDISADKISAVLNISKTAVEKAFVALNSMGLIRTAPEAVKSYTASDIASALQNPEFSFLADEVERIFGTLLSGEELKQLYNIYSSADLPPEVILHMTQFFKNDVRRRFGPGRRLSMSVLEKTAFEWRRLGINTLDKAEEYIKKRDNAYSLEGEMKRVMNIFDRKLVPNEKAYIDSWIDMGFKADAVQIAYERTISRLHSLSLPYMDKIILTWHKKDLHTADEINLNDPYERSKKNSKTQTTNPSTSSYNLPTQDETDRLRRYLDRIKEGNQ